eukprot:gene3848-2727_t
MKPSRINFRLLFYLSQEFVSSSLSIIFEFILFNIEICIDSVVK